MSQTKWFQNSFLGAASVDLSPNVKLDTTGRPAPYESIVAPFLRRIIRCEYRLARRPLDLSESLPMPQWWSMPRGDPPLGFFR